MQTRPIDDRRRPLQELLHRTDLTNHEDADDDRVRSVSTNDLGPGVGNGRFPFLDDVTADFVYVRLHGDEELYTSGYSDDALDVWAERVRQWRAGRTVDTGHTVAAPAVTATARDVYVYFDNDVKTRAPYDAMALAERLATG